MTIVEGTSGSDLIDEFYVDPLNNSVSDADDFVQGFQGDDTIFGLGGEDTIDGGADDDTLIGGAGADGLFGGSGIDTASYSTSSSVSITLADGFGNGGDAENDTFFLIENLIGSAQPDFLEGDSSDNRLEGGAGDDTLSGGAGGADVLIGGSGNDTATYYTSALAVIVSLLTGTGDSDTLTGIEHLTGSGSSDTLSGDDTGNTLNGIDGNDLLRGEFGNDILMGEQGNDTLDGGPGADYMVGGFQDDTYRVDNTIDLVDETGGNGIDKVEAEISFNLTNPVQVRGTLENLVLIGTGDIDGTGNTLSNLIVGNGGANALKGGGGADTLRGGGGDDTYFVDDLDDVVNETDGSGFDTVATVSSFSLASAQVVGAVESLVLGENANIDGTGNAIANRIIGNVGRNVLNGLGGGDTIFGLAGNDTVDGGAGADMMRGGGGDDTYRVDRTGDKAIEAAGGGADRVLSSASFKLGGSVENLSLTGSANRNGTGNALANTIAGNTGANILNGAAGNDVVKGGAGNDRVLGGAGNDRLFGGPGADVLLGGRGQDDLIGGAGADRFDFNAALETPRGAGRDIIQGFSRGQGDRIDLATIDADTSANPGNDVFAFIGSEAFHGGGGEVRFAGGILRGDINGDRLADFEIKVIGLSAMVAADFVL